MNGSNLRVRVYKHDIQALDNVPGFINALTFNTAGTQLAIAYGFNKVATAEQDTRWSFGKLPDLRS